MEEEKLRFSKCSEKKEQNQSEKLHHIGVHKSVNGNSSLLPIKSVLS